MAYHRTKPFGLSPPRTEQRCELSYPAEEPDHPFYGWWQDSRTQDIPDALGNPEWGADWIYAADHVRPVGWIVGQIALFGWVEQDGDDDKVFILRTAAWRGM